jgi:hypothetical protein
VEALSVLLARNPKSEQGLTALADFALIASILKRKRLARGAGLLAQAVGTELLARALQASASPGPEEWAVHVASAWLNPRAERLRLRDPLLSALVAKSEQIVLSLGPRWRPEEVRYVAACLHGSSLPALRPVRLDSATSPYELTHVAFYATDFGSVPASPDHLADEMAAVAARLAGELSGFGQYYDLGLELILAARFLSTRWPAEAGEWVTKSVPQWSSVALSTLRRHPEQFLALYHPMLLTALATAQFAADGGT